MPKKDTPRESEIVKRIIAALRRQQGCCVRKRHGGMFGTAGDPDITGCYQGQHFELEVKRPGQRLTELQKQRLCEWAKAGAIVACVDNVRDALLVVGIDPRETRLKK
jgi:hypothetical protein